MWALWLCVTAIMGAAGSRQPARSEDLPEVGVAMQDLSDAMNIKPQFNSFLNRVNADTDKLHHALDVESSKISDLELEKQSMQSEMANEKQRLTHELEVFKQKMIAKITDLKTNNRRLEETNMQLVSSNDKLAQELEAEKGKKAELVKKLKKMAAMFTRQQESMQQVLQSNSMKLESEVSDDVKDAMSAADSSEQYTATPAIHQPLPRTASVEADTDDDEDDIDKITATEDGGMSVPRKQSSATSVSVRPKSAPKSQQAPVMHATVEQVPPKAVAHPAAAAAKKAPATVKIAPKVAPKHVSSTSDDEQLKALRAEVENLESSVKNDDEADSAGQQPASSMLHVAKRTAKQIVAPKDEQSSSVQTLEQVGGMLSEAMAASDDDSDA